jgi:hypothetical protein
MNRFKRIVSEGVVLAGFAVVFAEGFAAVFVVAFAGPLTLGVRAPLLSFSPAPVGVDVRRVLGRAEPLSAPAGREVRRGALNGAESDDARGPRASARSRVASEAGRALFSVRSNVRTSP